MTKQQLINRVRNLLAAAGIFLYMWLAISNSATIAVRLILAVASLGGADAVSAAYGAMAGDLNIIQCAAYVLVGVPLAAFAWCANRSRAHVRKEGAGPEERQPQDAKPSLRCRFRSVWDVPGMRCLGGLAATAIGLQLVLRLLSVVFALLAPNALSDYQTMIDDSDITAYGIAWFLATIVLPPFVEETAFRGLGLTFLRRAGVSFAVANVVQALAFGIFHFNVYQGVYTFGVGLVLGYVAWRYRSVVPGMIVHAAYNVMGTWGTGVIALMFPTVSDLDLTLIGALLLGWGLYTIAEDADRDEHDENGVT